MISLIARLKESSASEESYFRRYLAEEDVKRIEQLLAMARSGIGREQFLKDGMYIGWTQGDMTTHRVKEEIAALLEAIFIACSADAGDGADAAVDAAWAAFADARLKRLIHCL